MWTRRAALLATGLSIAACSADGQEKSPRAAVDVVVVGAGIAGISAAAYLHRLGFGVEVVEARNRIGGRIHTVREWPGIPLDMGASWVHGAAKNPLSKIADQAGAERVLTSYESGALYLDPRLGTKKPRLQRWEDLIDLALKQAYRRESDESVADAVARVSPRLTSRERAELTFTLNARFVTEWGADPADLSAFTVDEGKEFAESGVDALFPGGYDQVVNWLARPVGVTTSFPVTSVAVADEGVTVSGPAGVRRARAAVLTVPLGVLKRGTIDITLPERTRAAIDALDSGVLSKSFFRFDKPFWPTSVDWHEYLNAEAGRWSEWVSFAKAGPPVLLGFNGGQVAREVEAADPGEVISQAHQVLRGMFGRSTPRPVAVKTSDWSTDQWALGSYSMAAVGSTRADRVALTKPIGEGVYLAGESTEPDYHSTVHGAYFSGRRAAKQVAEYLR